MTTTVPRRGEGRLMAVSLTEQQVADRTKTVTRRLGWWTDRHGRRLVRLGDHLQLCRKVQGRAPGEPIVRLARVQVVEMSRQFLYGRSSAPSTWPWRKGWVR